MDHSAEQRSASQLAYFFLSLRVSSGLKKWDFLFIVLFFRRLYSAEPFSTVVGKDFRTQHTHA